MNIHTFNDMNTSKSKANTFNYSQANLGASQSQNTNQNPDGNLILIRSWFNPKTFTFIILIVNLVIYIAQLIYFYTREKDSLWTCTLYLFGGKLTSAIVNNYHIWRLFTPIFLHASLIHITMNSISTIFMGFYVENYIGTRLMIILYFVSGVYGSLFSSVFSLSSVGVGASGAIFGLSGFLTLFFFLNFHKMPYQEKRFFIFFTIMTLINLFGSGVGKDGNEVDIFAHLGGFLAGAFASVFWISEKIDYTYFKSELVKKIKIAFGGCLGLMLVLSVIYLFGFAKVGSNTLMIMCK